MTVSYKGTYDNVGDMNNRRLALFVPSLRGGGAERVMVNLAREFIEQGREVDMVLATTEGPYLSEVHPEVRVVKLGARRVVSSLPSLVRYLRREQPAALLSTMKHANIVAIWARQIAGVPVRLVVREAAAVGISARNKTTIRGQLMPYLMRHSYRRADKVVANSHGVAEGLVAIAGVSAGDVAVICNPVVRPNLFARAEESPDHPWFRPGEPPICIGVGRLAVQKDFPTLIRAFALARKERPIRLMILGEGEERIKLETLVRQLGLEDDIQLPGFTVNPYKYMKSARLFVLSSQWEGSPNTLIEAVALGTTAVSTDCPSGPTEILEGGRLGLLVPVGDVGRLSQAILEGLERSFEPSPSWFDRFDAYQVAQQYLQALEGQSPEASQLWS